MTKFKAINSEKNKQCRFGGGNVQGDIYFCNLPFKIKTVLTRRLYLRVDEM